MLSLAICILQYISNIFEICWNIHQMSCKYLSKYSQNISPNVYLYVIGISPSTLENPSPNFKTPFFNHLKTSVFLSKPESASKKNRLRKWFVGQATQWGRNQWGSADHVYFRIQMVSRQGRRVPRERGNQQKQTSSTKTSSVRSEQLLRSGNLSRSSLWRVTADRSI